MIWWVLEASALLEPPDAHDVGDVVGTIQPLKLAARAEVVTDTLTAKIIHHLRTLLAGDFFPALLQKPFPPV